MKDMKFLGSILMIVLAAMSGVRAYAGARLGYCGEMEAGYGDAGGVLTPWVTFTPAMTDVYAGNEIRQIRIGLNAKANNVYVYIASEAGAEEYLCRQKVGSLEAGWRTVELDTPCLIEEGKPLAVGYKATFTRASGAAYTKGRIEDACNAWYNTKTKWIDVNGAFCIEALVDGDNMPENEVGLVSLADASVASGEGEVPMTLTVCNYGVNDVDTLLLGVSVDGADAGERSSGVTIAPGMSAEVPVMVPLSGPGEHAVAVEVIAVNGNPDTYAANNHAWASLKELDRAFMRKVVVEEATGVWCGWCPRGLVGLEMMAQKYGDSFIPISVHGGDDPFVTPSYEPFLATISSFPGCTVNRNQGGDPYYDIERLVSAEIGTYTPVGYSLDAFADGKGYIEVTSHVRVDKAMSGADIRFAFTVTEDGVTGNQANSYSGRDEEMAGWESLPPVVAGYEFADLARGIYPDYAGAVILDDTLSPGEIYEAIFSFPVPDNVSDIRHLKITGQVIDASNGFIINADRCELKIPDGVEVFAADCGKIIRTETYDLTGRIVSPAAVTSPSDATGVVIEVTYYKSGEIRTHKRVLTR